MPIEIKKDIEELRDALLDFSGIVVQAMRDTFIPLHKAFYQCIINAHKVMLAWWNDEKTQKAFREAFLRIFLYKLKLYQRRKALEQKILEDSFAPEEAWQYRFQNLTSSRNDES